MLHTGYVKIAIENGPVKIVSFPVQHGDFPVRYVKVYQAEYPLHCFRVSPLFT